MSVLARDESAWTDIDKVVRWGRFYDEQRDGGPRMLVITGGDEKVCEARWSSWTPRDDDPRGFAHDHKSAVAMLTRVLKERCAK